MSEVLHLVYSSEATVPVTESVLDHILKVSNERNNAIDISGLLLYRLGNFIQLIEGSETQVHRLYKRIKKDPRHKNPVTLVEFHSESRIFGDWKMGKIDDANENESVAARLQELLKNPLEFKDDMKGQVLNIFREVNRQHIK